MSCDAKGLGRFPAILACMALAVSLSSCAPQAPQSEDPQLASHGSYEVTARLLEIPGKYPNLPNYDYAFVMKYQIVKVHRGKIEGDTIYVAHYNPHKSRATAADARVEGIGGNLQQFEPGDEHRMALEVPIDDYYMGGIIDRYLKQRTGPIYWAVWTNRVAR